MKPIRVLHVFHGMDCGGAENMIMNLYRRIDRNQIQFDFLVHTRKECYFDDEIQMLGGKIYHVPYYNVLNQFIYEKALKDFFKNHPQYKIVHGHLGSCAHIYLKIAKYFGCFTIAHSHSTTPTEKSIKSTLYKIFNLQTRRIADYFFACGNKAGDIRFGKKIVSSNRYRVLNNAIDSQKYIFNPQKRDSIRSSLGINQDEFVIGTVGRLTLAKNPYKTIEILSLLKANNEQFHFLWIGGGEMETELKDAIKKAGLDDYVDFLGIRNDIPEVLQALDVFIFPSLWEGLGIVAVEAEASGLPTICSDAVPNEVDLTELVEHIPLSAPVEIWMDAILKFKNGYKRTNTQQQIIDGGYDIYNTAKWLGKFYLRVWNHVNLHNA